MKKKYLLSRLESVIYHCYVVAESEDEALSLLEDGKIDIVNYGYCESGDIIDQFIEEVEGEEYFEAPTLIPYVHL